VSDEAAAPATPAKAMITVRCMHCSRSFEVEDNPMLHGAMCIWICDRPECAAAQERERVAYTRKGYVDRIAALARELGADTVLNAAGGSRARSLAITKLQEAEMWLARDAGTA
jgi:hypothetical protein